MNAARPPEVTENVPSYSAPIGFIFIFNLIVGTGALTMPKAFGGAGYVFSTILLVFLAFTSYMTVTFMIEAMSTGNALRILNETEVIESTNAVRHRSTKSQQDGDRLSRQIIGEEFDETGGMPNEGTALLGSNSIKSGSLFEIDKQLEMAHLAQMVFSKIGVILFYISICVYLFGDLTIYAAAAPKSLRDVICTYHPSYNDTFPSNVVPAEHKIDEGGDFPVYVYNVTSDDDICWSTSTITRINAYRICVAIFFLCLGPFAFFNVGKTKYLQIFTSFMRWFAFGIMLVLTIIRLAKGEGQGHPPEVNLAGVPNLFGTVVYSFMCHHSLPSLTTPIKEKSYLTLVFVSNYILILLFYLALSYTEIFSFAVLMDLCTLNFQPNTPDPITNVAFFQYFLALFPAFTLSTNFPIISITLRNNLQRLLAPFLIRMPNIVSKVTIPFLVLIPPLGIAMATSDVSTLVGVTGSYAGVAIQYLVPAFLVIYSRRAIRSYLPMEIQYDERFKQKHRSIFSHWIWPVLVIVWSAIVVVVVTYYYLMML